MTEYTSQSLIKFKRTTTCIYLYSPKESFSPGMLHQDKQKSLPGVNNTKLYETANRRDILQRIN